MEQIDYAPLLPQTPPFDLVQWALEKNLFQREYLIYKAGRVYEPLEERSRPAVEVVCTHCGGTFYAEKVAVEGCCAGRAPAPFGWHNQETGENVISGDFTMCPICGGEVRAVHVGNVPKGTEESVYITIMSRLPAEGRKDRFVLTDWQVKRRIEKSGQSRYITDPYSAWVVEEKKIVRLMGYMKSMGNIHLFHKLVQRKTFRDMYGSMSVCYPWDKSILEGTTAENCKLDLYLDAGGKRLVSYLALWRKNPAVENLLVQGCGGIVTEWIKREMSMGLNNDGVPKLKEINWKEKRPAQMLGLNKDEFRHLTCMRWNADDVELYRMARDSGITVKLPEGMELLRTVRTYECNRILEDCPKTEFWCILRYLKRQGEHWDTLRDYWSMARADGQDVTDNLVRWPRDLKAAHNRQIEERMTLQQKEYAEVNNAREAMNNAREARKKAEDRRKSAEESLTAVQKELDELKAREPQIRELTDDERQALTYAAVAKARTEDVGRIQVLEKQLAQADPDTAAFKVLFTSWQETYMKMLEVLDRIRAEDSDKAEKLHDAVNAAAERMMKS